MKFKKLLAAAMAGLMLVGSAAAVSADGATVYTAEELYTKYYTTCSVHGVRYNYGYPCGTWCYYDGSYKLEANWNPYLGRYTYNPDNQAGYYWVNGVPYCYDTHQPYTPVVVSSTTTAATKPIEYSKEDGVTYNESSIPTTVIKKKPTVLAPSEVYKPNVSYSSTGTVYVQNPGLLGSVYNCVTLPGTYYAYDKVDINAFFTANSYNMYMSIGEYQTVDAGFKMVSSDSSVVRIFVNSEGNQLMKAEKAGSAYVYLYTGGGVPFMSIYVNVAAGTQSAGFVDIQPGTWRLDGPGSSTEIKLTADAAHTDVVLSVDKGNGTIKTEGGKTILVANANGPIVLKACSKANYNVVGYAIIYVGKYVDAIYDGYWTTAGGNITCNYWNPYLWNYDGYKINGYVLTDTGAYVPVIDRVGTYYSKPTGTIVNVYNDLYDMLYDECYGDYNTFYNLLWYRYNLNKPAKSFEELYGEALEEILKDIEGAYELQLLPWLKK